MDRAEAPALRRVLATAQIEWREATQGDDFYSFQGHAAVFNTRTTLFDGQYVTWTEQIDPGAFTDILASNPDVHFNIGHDMDRSVARTGIEGVGGMNLSEDGMGLLVQARLSPADPDVQALAAKLRLGVMDQMSFAFRPGQTRTTITTDDDGHETVDDTIVAVSDLIDVCVCARGAYPTTDAGLRRRGEARDAELAALRAASTPRPPSRASQLITAKHAAHIKFRR